MRLQRFEQQTGINTGIPNAPIQNTSSDLVSGLGNAGQALLGVAQKKHAEKEAEQRKIKTARQNAEVSRLINNYQLTYDQLQTQYQNGEIELEEMRDRVESYYRSDLFQGVDDPLVIQRVQPELRYMRDAFQIEMDNLQSIEVRNQAIAELNRTIDTQSQVIIGSNFDLKKRMRTYAKMEALFKQNVGTLIPEEQADEQWNKIERNIWQEAFLSDLSIDPHQAKEFLEAGAYNLDQDQITDSREKLDVAIRQADYQKYQLLQERILAGQEVNTSDLPERYQLGLRNYADQVQRQRESQRRAEAARLEKERRIGIRRNIFDHLLNMDMSPDQMKEEIRLATDNGAFAPQEMFNWVRFIDENYGNAFNSMEYIQGVLNGERDMIPSTNADQKLADGWYQQRARHVDTSSPDSLQQFQDDTVGFVGKFNAIPQQVVNRLKGIIAESNDTAAVGQAIEEFATFASASPEAAAGLSDRDPYISYLKLGASLRRSLPLEDIAQRIERYRARYQDTQAREELDNLAYNKNTTEMINDAVEDYQPGMQAKMKPLIRDYIRLGFSEGETIEDAVETASWNLSNSPIGFGTSVLTSAAGREDALDSDIYQYARFTDMPAERILGLQTEDEIVAMSKLLRQNLQESGFELEKGRTESRLVGAGGGISYIPSVPEEMPIYRLQADLNTPETKKFKIERINDDGTIDFPLHLPNGDIAYFDLNNQTEEGRKNHRKFDEILNQIRNYDRETIELRRIYWDSLMSNPFNNFGRGWPNTSSETRDNTMESMFNFPINPESEYILKERNNGSGRK